MIRSEKINKIMQLESRYSNLTENMTLKNLKRDYLAQILKVNGINTMIFKKLYKEDEGQLYKIKNHTYEEINSVINLVNIIRRGNNNNNNNNTTNNNQSESLQVNSEVEEYFKELFSKVKIGIEVEYISTDDKNTVKSNIERNTNEIINNTGYHRDNNFDRFQLSNDSSLLSGNDTGIEIITPILKSYEDFKRLEKILNIVSESGRVNKSTGLHVHISFKNGILKEKTVERLLFNYAENEKHIDNIISKSRRLNKNRYCRSIKSHISVRSSFNRNLDNEGYKLFMRTTKYCKVNTNYVSARKSLEFRQHQGTLDFTKIRNWAALLIEMLLKSRESYIYSDSFDEFLNKLTSANYIKEYFKTRKIELNRR